MPKPDIKSIQKNLLNEAIESLTFGLEFYDKYSLTEDIKTIKQAILHFQRFIELTLKYLAAQTNPILVFSNAFKEEIKIESAKTISFEQALTFYINNIKYGLSYSPRWELDDNQIKFMLSDLSDLRNKITHFFIEADDISSIDRQLAQTIELMYFIYLAEDISDIIDNSIPPAALDTLNSLMDTQKAALDKALADVDAYVISRSSLDPKEYHDNQAPVFRCPECENETLILNDKNTLFTCMNMKCKATQPADRCSVSIVCAENITPACYLSSWNEQDNSMICEECERHLQDRIKRK